MPHTAFACAPNDASLIARGTDSGSVFINSKSPTGEPVVTTLRDTPDTLWARVAYVLYNAHKSRVNDLAFSSNSTSLASASDDCTVKIWCVRPPMLQMVITTGDRPPGCIAWEPSGIKLAVCIGNTIRIFNGISGVRLHSLTEHTGSVTRIAWSPDATQLVSASYDGRLLVWDTDEGYITASMERHRDVVTAVVWTDDDTIVGASHDCTISVWRPAAIADLTIISTRDGQVTDMIYLSESRVLVLMRDGLLGLLDVARKQVGRLPINGNITRIFRCTATKTGCDVATLDTGIAIRRHSITEAIEDAIHYLNTPDGDDRGVIALD